MKYFGRGWKHLLDSLSRWNALPTEARVVFLERFKPPETVPLSDVDEEALRALLNRGFARIMQDGLRAKLSDNLRPLHRLLYGLGKVPLLERQDRRALRFYLQVHYTSYELAALAGFDRHLYRERKNAVSTRLESLQWLNEFLSAVDSDFEGDRISVGEESYLDSKDVLPAAQRMVRAFVELGEPVPVRQIPALFDDMKPSLLIKALKATLRFGILFASLRQQDLEPIAGLLPAIRERLRRPEAQAPRPLQVDTSFCHPFMVEDMAAIMLACNSGKLRLRGDYSLFVKEKTKIESTLTSIPEWIENLFSYSTGKRIEKALDSLHGLRWVETSGKPGKTLALKLTEEGKMGLAMSLKERLKFLYKWLRKHSEGDIDDYYDGFFSFRYLPPRNPIPWYLLQGLELEEEVTRAFVSHEEGVFLSLKSVLAFQSEKKNPLLLERKISKQSSEVKRWGGRRSTTEELEQVWAELLYSFFRERLLPLGCVALGRDSRKDVAFCLTRGGRYYLGAAGDFDFEPQENSEIVVQPNFEIVFLAPSPSAEAEMALFADRQGKHVGSLFKITRESIYRSGALGLTADQALETLKKHASGNVPVNVVVEMQNWFSRCRRVKMRSALLFETPDVETAERLLSAGGKDLIPLTDRMFEVRDTKKKAALIRKLRSDGLFL